MKTIKNLYYKLKEHSTALKVVITLLIVFLAFCDYYAIHDLMDDPHMDIRARDIVTYAALVAAILEGIPYFVGPAIVRMFDKTKYKQITKPLDILTIALGVPVLIALLGLIVHIRGLSITQYGGSEAFINGEYPKYVVDVILRYSPILTSIVAMIASAFAFTTTEHDKLEIKINNEKDILTTEEESYNEYCNKFLAVREKLWNSLAERDEEVPDNSLDYQEKVADKITVYLRKLKNRLFAASTSEVDAHTLQELENAKLELAKLSSVPDDILSIDLEELMQNYNNNRPAYLKMED